jgi:hypothetical protein
MHKLLYCCMTLHRGVSSEDYHNGKKALLQCLSTAHARVRASRGWEGVYLLSTVLINSHENGC